jgi:hypothetical protein
MNKRKVKKPSSPRRTSQGTWARSNVEEEQGFAENLAKVFQSHPSENEPEGERSTYTTFQNALLTQTTK